LHEFGGVLNAWFFLTELEIEAIIIAKQDRKQESPSIHPYPNFPHRYTWKGPTKKK
jgi:hypothetical protein